jgi:hypothetical protein
MCTDEHISAIIEYGALIGCAMYDVDGASLEFKGNEKNLAQRLKDANTQSINARYNEAGTLEKIKYVQRAESEWAAFPYEALQIIKLCDCFNYQACEVEKYENTEAFRIVETVKSWACRRLDGYDEAEWAI